MVCCKADGLGKWCQDHTIAYIDSYGDEYCLFHAPKEHKGISAEGFSEKVHSLIWAAFERNEKCDFSGTIFPDDISFIQFRNGKILPPINFFESIFHGEADFSEVAFSKAMFARTIFHGETDFSESTFSGKSDFTLAIFKGKTAFINATFSDAVFWGVNFIGEVDFSTTIFKGDTEFGKATFSEAKFLGAVFNCMCSFRMATFNGEIIFAEFEERMFKKNLLFIIANAGLGKIFFKDVNFSAIPFSFRATDLVNFRFDLCVWPRKKYFGLFAWLNNKKFWPFNSDETVVFYDEILADQAFATLNWREKLMNTDLQKEYGIVEDLYRQMKQQCKERHNEPEVSKWHYREKEMFRKKKVGRRYFPLSVTNLYWATSGYGERPVRAGVMLVLLFGVIMIVMNWLGLVTSTGKPVHGIANLQGFSFSPDWRKIGLVIQTIIEHTLFVKEPIFKAYSGWDGGIILAIWTKILIPTQAALFIFALRNKFRR